MGIFYTVIASIFWGLGNVIDHHLTAKTVKNPLALSFLALFLRIPIALIFFMIYGFFIPEFSILLITIFGGMVTAISIFFYYHSQEQEEASSVMLMFTVFSPIMILFLSFMFLGERLEGKEWIGFCILLAASILVSIRRSSKKFHLSGIFWMMLIATLGWTIADIVSKYATRFFPSPLHLFAWTMVGIGAGSFVFLFSNKWHEKGILDISRFKRSDIALHLVSVCLSTVGYLLFFQAMYLGKISILVVIASFIPFFSYLFELIFARMFPSFEREQISTGNLIIKGAAFLLFLFGISFLSVIQ